MEIINKQNYVNYLIKGSKKKLQDSGFHFYLLFIVVASAIIVYQNDWKELISITLILSTGFTTLFILVELYLTSIRKTIDQNAWISYTFLSGIIITLNLWIFNEYQFYLSIICGFLFAIPVLIGIIAMRVSNWFK